jgi:4-hydroxybenzoate polyprenyltransferase
MVEVSTWGKGFAITLRPIVSMVTIPWTAAMAVFAASLYGGYTGMWTDGSFWETLVLVVLASWLGVTAGYAVNDYFDYTVDMANQQRVDKAANHGIPRRDLLTYAAVLGIPSLLIWLYLSPLAFAVAVIQVLCVLAYSAWAKPRTAMSNLLVVLPTALMPITVFFVYTDVLTMEAVLLASVNLVFEPGFTWAGVCRDVEGDRKRGVPTLPAVYGLRTASGIILACWMALAALTLVMWYYAGMGLVFLAGGMFSALWLVANGVAFVKDPTPVRGGATFLRAILWFWVFSLALILDVSFHVTF